MEEHLVFDNAIYLASTSSKFRSIATQLSGQTQLSSQVQPQPVKTIQPSQHKELSNPLINAVVSLANETARAGYGALVFSSSRAGCERDAILISQVLPAPENMDDFNIEKRFELLNDLRSTATGLDATLEKTIPYGVAFHRKLAFCHIDVYPPTTSSIGQFWFEVSPENGVLPSRLFLWIHISAFPRHQTCRASLLPAWPQCPPPD